MKTFVMGLISLMWVNVFAYTDINTRFYFDTDKDTLNEQQRTQLDQFIQQALTGKKYREVYIVGFTDADGTSLYNMNLSERRAKHVSELLISKGIPEAMIDKAFKGEGQPIATNNTEEGKSMNRRVEVILRTFEISKAADIIHEIKGNPAKKLIADNTKEIIVHGEKGIKVIFPPNCFQTADNKNIDPKNIVIELEEVRTVQDALFSGVLSQTGTQPLETGGMFRVKVTQEGKELKMKTGMQYSVQLSNDELKNDMKVFTPAPTPAGLVAWSATKEEFKKDSTFKGEKPSIKLDKDIVNAWTMEYRHDGFLERYIFRLPTPPNRPALYKRPKDVKVPVRDFDNYYIPWIKRAFMTKAAELAYKEKIYQAKYDLYVKQHNRFLAKLDKYLKDSVMIADQTRAYEEANVLYAEQLKEVGHSLLDYRRAMVENAIKGGFEQMKVMLINRSNKKQLDVTDVYPVAYQCLNVLAKYKNLNGYYQDAYREYSEKFRKVCERDFPDSGFQFIPRFNPAGNDFNYLYNYAFLLLRSDKNVSAHFDQAIQKYMDDQVASGMFQPGNFSTYYQANLNSFGWINCDRFYNTPPENMITVQVPDYDIKDKNLIVVVKDMNSTLAMNWNGKNYQVSVPKNQEIVILAIGLDKNLSPVFARADIKPAKNVEVQLPFKNVKLSEIKESISSI